jgi:hypothetical protein
MARILRYKDVLMRIIVYLCMEDHIDARVDNHIDTHTDAQTAAEASLTSSDTVSAAPPDASDVTPTHISIPGTGQLIPVPYSDAWTPAFDVNYDRTTALCDKIAKDYTRNRAYRDKHFREMVGRWLMWPLIDGVGGGAHHVSDSQLIVETHNVSRETIQEMIALVRSRRITVTEGFGYISFFDCDVFLAKQKADPTVQRVSYDPATAAVRHIEDSRYMMRCCSAGLTRESLETIAAEVKRLNELLREQIATLVKHGQY